LFRTFRRLERRYLRQLTSAHGSFLGDIFGVACCTDLTRFKTTYATNREGLLLERESEKCVGELDAGAFQIYGLRNRARIEKLL